MMAAAFAEAGEHDYAAHLLSAGKNSHKKVLLSTDCPIVTGKVLDHALNLCRRLGSMLEVYQIIPSESLESTSREFFETGTRRLQSLKERLGQIGISYNYTIKEASLEEELTALARSRRDILAVIIPRCEGKKEEKKDFEKGISKLFSCPVIFFDSELQAQSNS